MPRPSSVTRMRLRPPAWISTGERRGLGVEGILHQFLDDAGGALDHFAGGDLVGDLLGEKADAVHWGRWSVGALERGERGLIETDSFL